MIITLVVGINNKLMKVMNQIKNKMDKIINMFGTQKKTC